MKKKTKKTKWTLRDTYWLMQYYLRIKGATLDIQPDCPENEIWFVELDKFYINNH